LATGLSKQRSLSVLQEEEGNDEPKKGQLKGADRDEFEDMLRSAAMDRQSVKNCMGFALDHCHAAEEVRARRTEGKR
jgi:hypothetical protein